MSVDIRVGDCLDVMPTLDANSVDAIVCDPPYGLAFMGKAWDHGVPGEHFWREALRVAKPGAHLAAFGGTRTYHRLTVAIEDAGWEIRDCLSWLYGSGFPKSLDVSKAIDKAAGVARGVLGPNKFAHLNGRANVNTYGVASRPDSTAPATDAAKQWDGWGTALKPAWEPIILARKPLIGTVARNVQAHGTGALNIDGCRIGTEVMTEGRARPSVAYAEGSGAHAKMFKAPAPNDNPATHAGRWPANVVLDEEAAAMLDEQSGDVKGAVSNGKSGVGGLHEYGMKAAPQRPGYADSGGASRFFYTAKASRSEREEGLFDFPSIRRTDGRESDIENPRLRTSGARNHHPTVKPLDLMRWLCRLVTPPNGLILDPFTGSGSTGCAAMLDGFRFIGIEREADYAEIARARIAYWYAQYQPSLFSTEPAA